METYALVLFGGLMLFCVPITIRLWRDAAPQLRDVPPGWILGTRMWHAFMRAMPTAVVGGVSLAGAGIVGEATDSLGQVPVLVAVMLVLAAISFVSMVLMSIVMLWNVPKILVPPHLRGRPGLLGDRDRTPTNETG